MLKKVIMALKEIIPERKTESELQEGFQFANVIAAQFIPPKQSLLQKISTYFGWEPIAGQFYEDKYHAYYIGMGSNQHPETPVYRYIGYSLHSSPLFDSTDAIVAGIKKVGELKPDIVQRFPKESKIIVDKYNAVYFLDYIKDGFGDVIKRPILCPQIMKKYCFSWTKIEKVDESSQWITGNPVL